MNARVLTSVKDIRRDDWNALCGNDVSFCYEWFLTLEESGVLDVKPRHIMLEVRGRAVGLLPCFIQVSDPYFSLESRLYGPFAAWFRRVGLGAGPALLAYSPAQHRTEIFLAPGADKAEALEEVGRTMDRICRSERVSVSGWLFANGNDGLLIDRLKRARYAEAFLCPLANWENRCRTFEDYLGGIKSRSKQSHKAVRRELNRFSRLNVTITDEPVHLLSDAVMAEMYERHYKRYNPNLINPFTAEFFGALKRNFRGRIDLLAAKDADGKLISYTVILKGPDNWQKFLFGELDYRTAHAGKLYFHVNYYTPIRRAIEAGVKTMHYGLGTYPAKIQRGCVLTPLHMLLKAHTPAMRIWLTIWMRVVDIRYRYKYRAYRNLCAMQTEPLKNGEKTWTPRDPVWIQSVRFIQKEGWRAFLKLLCGKIIQLVYERKTIVAYAIPLDNGWPRPVPKTRLNPTVRRLLPEEIMRLRPITSTGMLARFKKYAEKGFRCYVAEVNGMIAAYSWFTDSPYTSPITGISFPLEEREWFVAYSHTLRGWRKCGMNNVLKTTVFNEFKSEGARAVRTTVSKDNIASTSANRSLGARPSRAYYYFRVFGQRHVTVSAIESKAQHHRPWEILMLKFPAIRALSTYTGAVLGGQGLVLLRGILLARIFGPAAFGLWRMLKLVLDYVTHIPAGTLHALRLELPEAIGSGDTKRVCQINQTLFSVNLLAGGAASVLFLLAAVAASRFAWTVPAWAWIALAALAPVHIVYNFIKAKLAAEERVNSSSAIVLTFAALAALGMPAGALAAGLAGALAGLFLAYLVPLLWLVLKGQCAVFSWPKMTVLKPLWKTGFPIWLAWLPVMALYDIDQWLVAFTLGTPALGLYGIAVFLGGLLQFIPTAYRALYQPYLLRQWGATRDWPRLKPYFIQSLQFMAYAAPLAIAFLFFLADALVFLFLPNYAPGLWAAKAYCLSSFWCMLTPITYMICIATREKRRWILQTAGALSLHVLATVLTLHHGGGLPGAAVCVGGVYAVYTIFQIHLALSLFGSHERGELARLVWSIGRSFIFCIPICLLIGYYQPLPAAAAGIILTTLGRIGLAVILLGAHYYIADQRWGFSNVLRARIGLPVGMENTLAESYDNAPVKYTSQSRCPRSGVLDTPSTQRRTLQNTVG